MDYSELILRAARVGWREKQLWLLGFMAVLGATIADIARARMLSLFSRQDGSLLEWLSGQAASAGRPPPSIEVIGNWLIWGALALFAASTLIWLLATWAEASLIVSVLGLESGQRTTLGVAIGRGWRLLSRFIAIDAVVFSPIFLLLLLLMLGGLAALAATVLVLQNGTPLRLSPALPAVGVFCFAPLLCLLFPLSMVTAIFRTFAFREAAMRPVGVRQSVRGVIRHTAKQIRAHLGNVLIWLALLWGIRYLFGTVTSLVNIALLAAAGSSQLSASAAESGQGGLLDLAIKTIPFVWIPAASLARTILYTFTAAAWTMVYAHICGGAVNTSEASAAPA